MQFIPDFSSRKKKQTFLREVFFSEFFLVSTFCSLPANKHKQSEMCFPLSRLLFAQWLNVCKNLTKTFYELF